MSYQALIDRLQRELGLDPQSIGALTLQHGIDEACATLDCRSVAELHARTCASEADWRSFVDLMVVPETWFFRVPEQFDDLVRQLRGVEARPLRVLSLPCSTGEEPYSIAAALLQAGWAPQSFEILGVDVSGRAIEHARRAQYRSSSVRGLDPEPWIARNGDHWQPIEAVRRSVRFLCANALQPGALPAELRFHAVLCRNLLIYLDSHSRTRLLELLLSRLEPGGLIYAGQAEALSTMDPRLRAAPGYGPLSFDRKPIQAALQAPLMTAAVQRTPAQPLTAPTRAPVAPRTDTPGQLLAQAQRLADRGDLAGAREQCEACLRLSPESADAWFLLGTIEIAARHLDAAEAALTRVNFLARDHLGAIEQRAALAEAQGRPSEAAQLRARWQRLATAEGAQ